MPSPYNVAKEMQTQLVMALNEIVQCLHPYQAEAAANRIRLLDGDKYAKEFYAQIANTIEQDVKGRQIRAIREASPNAPEPVGKLDRAAIDAVVGLPQNVRGAMFNAHGEPLVYGIDNVAYHGDAEWDGYKVEDGKARGLVVSGDEAAFIEALWVGAEEVRKAKEGS